MNKKKIRLKKSLSSRKCIKVHNFVVDIDFVTNMMRHTLRNAHSDGGRQMYTKLFSKILYSSIWNENAWVRCLWMTFLAAQDLDGYIACATMENLARLANLPLEETTKALAVLMAPDPQSANPANEGRRIEQVPGGFLVLNSAYYKNIQNRENEREMNRIRAANYRLRKKNHANRDSESDGALATVTPVSVSISSLKSAEKLSSLKSRGSRKDCAAYAVELGLPASDGESFFDGKEGNGWKNGRNPVKDWKATMRNWKANKWHASQRPGNDPLPAPYVFS